MNFRQNEGRLYLSSSELDTKKAKPTQNEDREQDLVIYLQDLNWLASPRTTTSTLVVYIQIPSKHRLRLRSSKHLHVTLGGIRSIHQCFISGPLNGQTALANRIKEISFKYFWQANVRRRKQSEI